MLLSTWKYQFVGLRRWMSCKCTEVSPSHWSTPDLRPPAYVIMVVAGVKTTILTPVWLWYYGTCIAFTHRGRVTHIIVNRRTNFNSDNGLASGRRQAIIWTNAGMLIGPLWTNFSEIWMAIYTFSFKKMHLKMPFGKWRPFYLGLNVLKTLSKPCYKRGVG